VRFEWPSGSTLARAVIGNIVQQLGDEARFGAIAESPHAPGYFLDCYAGDEATVGNIADTVRGVSAHVVAIQSKKFLKNTLPRVTPERSSSAAAPRNSRNFFVLLR
jgi:hypothetical protein